MTTIGWIGDHWHWIEFKDHPNPVKSIQLQVLAVAPCGATLDHIPLLGAMQEPTCPACLKVFRGPKEWSPRPADPGQGGR